MKIQTWEDVERAALFDPVLHRAVTMVTRGDCTREEALIAAALFYSARHAESKVEELEHLRNLPATQGLPASDV